MIVSNRRTSKNLFHAARSHFFRAVNELNLFSSHPIWSSTLNHSEQILSTRLFIYFLFISILLIILYGIINIRTHHVTYEQFSISDYETIQAHYPTSIYASCTQIANPYSKLIHVTPHFHEICSSSFITNSWISSLFLANATSHNILDFRSFTFAQFQALALLCQTAQEAIDDGLRTFHSTRLITTYLRSRSEFNEIAHVLITNLRNHIIASENQMARIVSTNIGYNRLISALRTNFYIRYDPFLNDVFVQNGLYLRTKGNNSSSICGCRYEGNQCTYPAGAFYNWTKPELYKPAQAYPPPRYRIPGLMAGCLPLESIRQSTLECFYSQTCVNILSIQPNISTPKPLQISRSNFSRNLTIGKMFDDHLFVQSWQNTSNYESYFNACAPRSLTYSYQGSERFSSIFSQCFDASGGLAIIWALLIPLMIRYWPCIKSKKQQIQTTTVDTKPVDKDRCIQRLRQTITTLNLFPSDNKDDIEEEYIGIIATRLYILLLFFGLISLVFFTSLLKRSQTFTVHSPTMNEFERFDSLYKSNFRCKCTYHSLSYGRVVSISPQYHQICSSEFVTNIWLTYFNLNESQSNRTVFLSVDFRISGQPFFNFADALCRAAKETVENALHSFRYHRLITLNTLSRREFTNEMKTRVKQFQQQTIALFVNLIELIRASIQTNHLVTDQTTNTGIAMIKDKQTGQLKPRFHYTKLYNSSCWCGFSSRCTRPQGFYLQSDDHSSDPKISIPGLVLGCYTIDSLLQSTFECFYEQKCIQLLIDSRNIDVKDLLPPLLNSTRYIQALHRNNSRFSPKTRIESIVFQLFIETWNESINFTSYYNRCAPKYCTYTINKRFDWSYTIAMGLGLYKTLSVILELVLPSIVRFLIRFSKKQLNRSCFEFRKISQSIRSWNLFATKVTSDNEQMKQQEIYVTRIYIFLFVLCLIIVILCSGPLNDEIKIKQFLSPTFDQVNILRNKNISTLSCKCSITAISYSKFLSIKPKYHSICSSKYVQTSYRMKFFEDADRTSLELNGHYRMLAKLCQQAQRTIDSARKMFDTRDLISVETMTNSSFQLQTDALIETFISELLADYRRILTFIMRSFEVNHLFNVFSSNWRTNLTNESEHHILSTYPRPFSSTNCSCATSFDCTERVDGDIVSGCFVYDGFRLSKFENISLGQLNEQLFVERWINTSNYTAYFETCHPLECRYTLPDQFNLKTILLNILELYGSLTWILHYLVEQSLFAYRWWLANRLEITVLQ